VSCIYLVTNKVNGKQYVGKTKGGLSTRRKEHERMATSGKLSTMLIVRAIRKYGSEEFEWIEAYSNVPCECLEDLEKECIWWYGTKFPEGYNLTDGGEGINNPSNCVRNKISKATSKRMQDPAERKRISLRMIGNKHFQGKTHSKETRRLLSTINKGNKHFLGKTHTESTRERLRIGRLGKKHTEEAKEKNRKAHIGKKHSFESRLKISLGGKGKKRSVQTRLRISKARKGMAFSEEHYKNLSLAVKRYYDGLKSIGP
jgi:group I intron endonuclease